MRNVLTVGFLLAFAVSIGFLADRCARLGWRGGAGAGGDGDGACDGGGDGGGGGD